MKLQLRNLRESIVKTYRSSPIVKQNYYAPIKWINRAIRTATLPEFIMLNERKFYLDKYDSLNLSANPNYEGKFFRDFLKKNVKKGDNVLNIGANIGYYAVILSKLVGNLRMVYAFEPDMNNWKLLKKNTKGLSCFPIRKAVSDYNGFVNLYLAEYNLGDHRIYPSNEERYFVKVPVCTIDKEIKTRVDFALIDTQGSDFKVIRGMKKTIKRNPNIKIVVEFDFVALKRAGEEPRECLEEIKRMGFRIFDIDKKNKVVKEKSVSEILDTYNSEDKITDLFLTKEEKYGKDNCGESC